MSDPHGPRDDDGSGSQRATPTGSDVGLLEQLAEFSQSAGEFGSAMEYYEQMLRIAEKARESSDILAQIYFRMARCRCQVGEYVEAVALLDRAKENLPADPTVAQLCQIETERAYALTRLGDYDAAESCVDEVTSRILDPPTATQLARAQKCAGVIAMRRGSWETASRSFQSALAGFRTLHDREGVAECLNNLGLVERNRGNHERAVQHLEAALKVAQEIGDTHYVGACLNNLGIPEFRLGRWEAARERWERAHRLLDGIGNRWEVGNVALNLAKYHQHKRSWDEARRYLATAGALVEELGEAREIVLLHELEGDLALAMESWDDADREYRKALAGGRKLAPEGDLVLEALRRLADLESRTGRLAEARRHLMEAVDLADRLDDAFEKGVLLRIRARLEAAQGDVASALEIYQRSLDAQRACEVPFELAVTQLEFASFCIENIVELEDAARNLDRARRTFEHVGAQYEAGHAYLMTAKLEMVCDHPTGEARHHLESAIELLERVGNDDDRAELRAVNGDIDRLLEETSLSDRNDLAALNEAVSRIQAAEDTEARVRAIEEALEGRMSADRVGLFLLPEGAALARAPGSSLSPAVAEEVIAIVEKLRGEGEFAPKPLVSTSPARDPRFSSVKLPGLRELGSVAFMPLFTDEEMVGGLYVDVRAEAGYFHQPELDFLVAFAAAALMAVQELRLDAVRDENMRLRRELAGRSGNHGIITQNRRMLEIVDLVERLRDSRSSILIQGETGTGKELVAHAVHAASSAADRQLVTVNCAALARDLLESELFGHVRGAFTDARTDKMGLFEKADGGTIFLDEIDKTSSALQERLLRAVDEGEIKPVGANDVRHVNVRVVCAANRPLRGLVEEGCFLSDLYYRLRVISIDLPPLRERKEDVPLLVAHFLNRLSHATGKHVAGFSHEAMNLMVAHSWPGNVRDLLHEVERAVAMAEEGALIEGKDLSEDVRSHTLATRGLLPDQSLAQYVEEIERDLVRRALEKTAGNRSRAARLLGISRRGLLNKIARYSIDL